MAEEYSRGFQNGKSAAAYEAQTAALRKQHENDDPATIAARIALANPNPVRETIQEDPVQTRSNPQVAEIIQRSLQAVDEARDKRREDFLGSASGGEKFIVQNYPNLAERVISKHERTEEISSSPPEAAINELSSSSSILSSLTSYFW